MSLTMCLLGIVGLYILFFLIFYIAVEIFLRIYKINGRGYSFLAVLDRADKKERKLNYIEFGTTVIVLLSLFPLLKLYLSLTEQLREQDYQFYMSNIFPLVVILFAVDVIVCMIIKHK